MRTSLALITTGILAGILAGGAAAEGERAGAFDYYVLALSWSPTWCALEGDAREARECDGSRDLGWTLHGLWPQYEAGWPSFCPSAKRAPSRADTAAMADIMGSSGLAFFEWKKHGRCSGLSADAYFAASRRAYEQVVYPEALERLGRVVEIDAAVVEEAFLAENPAISGDGLTIVCEAGRIAEVRICLDRALEPRACAPDVARDCRDRDALLDPVR